MFINVSNHPVQNWSLSQIRAAEIFGEIHELPFPQIDPDAPDDDINSLVEQYGKIICEFRDVTAMVQGEYVFTYRLVERLKQSGIKVVAASSARRTVEHVGEGGATIKTSEYVFVRFREY